MIERIAALWRWLIKPALEPPIPRDENLRGLGWAGDRPVNPERKRP